MCTYPEVLNKLHTAARTARCSEALGDGNVPHLLDGIIRVVTQVHRPTFQLSLTFRPWIKFPSPTEGIVPSK